MGTIADKLNLLESTKEGIKVAIASKGQSVADTDPFSSYPDKIAAIQTGIDTSDATAAASDIASGKTAYVDGEKVTGTISPANGNYIAASTTDSGDGYVRLTQPKFTPSVLVTSSSTMSLNSAFSNFGNAAAANVLSGKTFTSTAGLKVIGTMPTKAATTITPGTSAKTAISAGTYASGTISVAGDANLKAANILSGVSIFGIAGTAFKYYSGEIYTLGSNVDKGLYSVKYRAMSSYLSSLNTESTALVSTVSRRTAISAACIIIVTATCGANYPNISVTNGTAIKVGYPTVAATSSAKTQGTWIVLPSADDFVINVLGTATSPVS